MKPKATSPDKVAMTLMPEYVSSWCGHGFESHSQPFLLTYPGADLSLWRLVFYFQIWYRSFHPSRISHNLSSIKPILDENNVKLVGVGPEQLGSKEFYNDKVFDGGWLKFSVFKQLFLFQLYPPVTRKW